MNPGQGGRALPDGRESAPRRRLQVRGNRKLISSFPKTTAAWHTPRLRCVGVGKCRRDEGGVMCPSFRVTRDEEHSTRGRAHLLWEMTKGDVHPRRLARRARERVARSLPRLQGLQERLPGRRRRGHLQGRVSLSLLRRTSASAQRLCLRQHRYLGAAGLELRRAW